MLWYCVCVYRCIFDFHLFCHFASSLSLFFSFSRFVLLCHMVKKGRFHRSQNSISSLLYYLHASLLLSLFLYLVLVLFALVCASSMFLPTVTEFICFRWLSYFIYLLSFSLFMMCEHIFSWKWSFKSWKNNDDRSYFCHIYVKFRARVWGKY